ncbi:MAG: chemotaxis protein CheA [Deltaproteobacteria bacterium]|nr:chemotaxis protein CheA [Deltaproteobacteria bacterium]
MSELDETLQIFFSETDELVKSAEESLLALESTPESTEDIEQLFRSVHTMKSGAAMVGFMGISEYAHLVESLMERLRSGKLAVTNNLITFLLDAIDFIRSMLDRVAEGEAEADPEVLSQRQGQVKRYLGVEGATPREEEVEVTPTEPPEEPAEVVSFYKIDLDFEKHLFHSGQDPLLLLLNLSELAEFVTVVPDLSELPDFENLSMFDLFISWQIIVKTKMPREDLDDVFMFVMDDNDIRIEDITKDYREGIDTKLADKRLGEVLVGESKITEETLTDALKKQKLLGEILVEEGKIQPEELQKAVSAQEQSRKVYRKTTIRVDVDKIDRLVNLGEEMGISLSKAQLLLEELVGTQRLEILEEMENLLKVNREFQERVARVRMFPLEGTFRRFQRMARDLALAQNKRIKVTLAGLDTELDKEVIEYCTDPLKHLVRNCVDHGIEPPEDREAKGKPAEGTLELRAYQRGGRIFVEIGEDGRGIDLQGIHQKAVEKAWIQPKQVLSEQELLDFIFRPGFSTTTEVTELSGRGVGMDVVKTQLDQLGGTIEVRTKKDRGTTFILCLPLTSALMEVLHVVVQGTSYLVPVQVVVGTERFEEGRVKQVGSEDRVYPFRGDYLPLVNLAKVLDTGTLSTNGNSSVVIFVDTGTKTFGMAVDELLEPQQIIVKTLETNYRSVKGLAGATILGDGSVSLVLDLLGLEEIFFKTSFKGDEDDEGEEKDKSG